MPEPLLKVAAVAERTALSVPAVLALINAGKIVASNVSQGLRRPRWRVAPADLEQFLASRQPAATSRIVKRRRAVAMVEYV